MTTTSFSTSETPLYPDTEHVFEISFDTINALPDNGSIKFEFSNIGF